VATLPYLGFAPPGVLAQDRATPANLAIEYAPSCGTCAVSLEKVLEIGGPDGVLLHPSAQLERDSRGNYLATAYGRTSIVVFDSAGRRRRVMGASGEGPGEISGSIQRFVVGRGDTVYVFDTSQRIIVFSATGAHVRTVLTPVSTTSAFQAKPGLVAIGLSRVGSRRVPGVNMFTGDGREPVAIPSAQFGLLLQDASARVVMPGRDSASFWLVQPGRYALSLFGLDGAALAHVNVTGAPWLRVTPRRIPTGQERQELLRILGDTSAAARARSAEILGESPGGISLLAHDRHNRLWILGNPSSAVRSAGVQAGPVLNIVDLGTRLLLLSQELPHTIRMLAGTELVYSRHADADGVVTFRISRIRTVGF
jgi:hypothetical protein